MTEEKEQVSAEEEHISDEKEHVSAIEELASTYYGVLQVSVRASHDEIEDAYHELARRLHPDVTNNDPRLTEIYMGVNEAYQVLSNPAEREEYDRKIGTGEVIEGQVVHRPGPRPERSTTPAQDMRLLDAKLLRAIKQANKLCEQGSYWEASRMLERFLRSHPDNAPLRKSLANAALGRKSYHEAVNHMKVACRVEYHDPENFVLLARIYLMAGQILLAQRAVGEAISWNATHEGAQQVLREIQEVKDEESPPLVRFVRKLGRSMKKGEK